MTITTAHIFTASKLIFPEACDKNSAHRGGCLPHCMVGYSPPRADTTPHPPEQTSLAQCILGDTDNKRAVRILLECILVLIFRLGMKSILKMTFYTFNYRPKGRKCFQRRLLVILFTIGLMAIRSLLILVVVWLVRILLDCFLLFKFYCE